MDRKIKIGLVQFGGKLGEVESNVAHALDLIAEAASGGAQIVCLPELFATGYNLSLLEGKSITLGSRYYEYISQKMAAAAQKFKIHLIAPFARKTDLPGILANSALIFDNEGKPAGYFDKTHLWALERLYFMEGNTYPVFDLKIGDVSVKTGIMICYDAGFPEACRSLALGGAEIVFCPAAWRIQDVDVWDLNMRQRALENLLFTAGINRAGKEGDLHLFGKCKICNPLGQILTELPQDKEMVGVFEIDLNDVERIRTEMPYLRDRKPHIYQTLLKHQR
ncbi:carbon-nitrogen hydrolase [Spirochaetia bacterium]|nr:carbon-nitrogen hydrolase [Spirochaetia bacterium]